MEKSTLLHKLFRIGVLIKGINGILEITAAAILFFVKTNLTLTLIQNALEQELVHDPRDFLANHLYAASQHITPNTITFIAIYLLVHGIINIIMFSGLWYNKKWAYPLSTLILSMFIVYQLSKFSKTHSITLLSVTLIDLTILFLLNSEYKRIQKQPKDSTPTSN